MRSAITLLIVGVCNSNSRCGCCHREFSFETGDRLLLYTDGLLAENAAGQSFGDTALNTFIEEKQDLGAEQFVELLLGEVLSWSSDGTQLQQKDDITILVMDFGSSET